MAGVRSHEEKHGRMAREMARVAERAMRATVTRADAGCGGLRAELKRRVGAIYEDYDRRQNAYDAREHRKGGHVEGLIAALIR
jgi:predicted secreted Zn-dependent protease